MFKFLNLAKNRRSIRSYQDEKISKEEINKIIEAGLWAPSAWNKQLIKFFVLENKEKIKQASAEIAKLKQKFKLGKIREIADPVFYQAPQVVFLCINEKEAHDLSYIDSSLVLQNCLLQAEELDLATVIIGHANLLEKNSELKKNIGFPQDWRILIAFCLGKTSLKPEAPVRKAAEVLFKT